MAEIYAVGEVDGRPYLVMELLAGASLGALLSARGRLDPEQVVRIAEVRNRGEAEMLQSVLAGNDIESLLTGDGMIDTAYGIPQVFVLVRPEDEERARDVLAEALSGDLDLGEEWSEGDEG